MISIQEGAFAYSDVSSNAPAANYPASIAAGDILLWIVRGSTSTTITPPTGFGATPIASFVDDNTGGSVVRIYGKDADGTETGVASGSFGSTYTTWGAVCTRISGAGNLASIVSLLGLYHYLGYLSITTFAVTTGVISKPASGNGIYFIGFPRGVSGNNAVMSLASGIAGFTDLQFADSGKGNGFYSAYKLNDGSSGNISYTANVSTNGSDTYSAAGIAIFLNDPSYVPPATKPLLQMLSNQGGF